MSGIFLFGLVSGVEGRIRFDVLMEFFFDDIMFLLFLIFII